MVKTRIFLWNKLYIKSHERRKIIFSNNWRTDFRCARTARSHLMNFKSVMSSKHPTQFSNRRSNSLSYPISMPSVVFFINLREKSESFESYSSTSDHFTRYNVTLRLGNNFQKSGTNYRRLQLPVHARNKNMFCWPIKIQSFDNQTSKFTCPLGNVLAPLT